jgi:uncharacterized protein YgiM (DUF1202 family)
MSMRSRLAIAAAVGVLAASAAATPAVATDEGSGDTSTSSSADGTGGDGLGSADSLGSGGNGGGHHGDQSSDPRFYKGVVTARTLALRSAPNRGSQIIRYAHKGDIVKIFCKTGGETVDGNPLWYLLPDGTWAWGSARYIDNIGPTPRWC